MARTGSNGMVRSQDLEHAHKKIANLGLQCRQQQMEIHELRCTVRKYKATLENVQDEVRMIRQLLDKKWLSSPRGARGNNQGGREESYYNEKEGGSKPRWRGDNSITHEEIVDLACTVLRRYPGGMAIAKLGTLMHKEANNHALPSILKERYGGLKKFLQGQQDKCVMGHDHPYNPHVTLRPAHRTTQNYALQVQGTPVAPPNTPPPPGTPNNNGTIGDPVPLDNTSASYRRARRRRAKKRGGIPTLSPPNSPRDLVIGGPSTGVSPSPAAGLLHNTQPLKQIPQGNATRPIGGLSASALSTRGISWSGVVSAPGTPLAATWTEHNRPSDGHVPRAKNPMTSMTPDGGVRSSSLFTSSLSSRLRTNVLKSAYIIKLPPYAGGPKLTRVMAIACGMVAVNGENGTRVQKPARAVVVNLYGHVLFDECIHISSDILDYQTKESGVRPEDMKRAGSGAACRQKLQSLLHNRLVVAYESDNLTKELQVSIPTTLLRDTKKSLPSKAKNISLLAQEKLGISASTRNPIEDARAIMAIYLHSKEEIEKPNKLSSQVSSERKSDGPMNNGNTTSSTEIKSKVMSKNVWGR